MAVATCQISELSNADREVLERLLGEPLGDCPEVTIMTVASTGRSKIRVGDNPYSSPQAAPLRTRFKNSEDKWTALGLIGLGVAMSVVSIAQIVVYRRVSGFFVGISIALFVLGWLKYSLSTRVIE